MSWLIVLLGVSLVSAALAYVIWDIRKLRLIMQSPPDHFHQLLNDGDHIVNGSRAEHNVYTRQAGGSQGPERQPVFLVHSRNGVEEVRLLKDGAE